MIGRGKDNFISVFKPVPEKREAMTRRSMPPPMKDKKGFYREEDFRDLTIFSNKEQEIREEHRRQDDALEQKLLEDIRKANLPKNNAGEEKPIHIHPNDQANGKDYQFQPFDRDKVILGEKPLTDAQFSAAALAACFQPKHTFVNSTLNKAEYDPTVVPALVNCGLSQEEAVRLCSASGRSMGTLDLFIAEPRDNSGTRFKDYVNEGRKDAAEAFRQYQQGNKEPLAKLIAEGVNTFALDFNQCTQNRLPTQGRGTAVMAEELLGILEQEPELGELARQQGMKTENLNCLQGIVKTLNLEKQARNAEYEIAKARVDHTDLDKAKKKELARQIIMSRVACGKLVEHRKAMEEDKTSKGNQLKAKIKWIDIPRDPDGMPLPYEQWPMPKPGEVYNISMSAVHGGITCVYGPLPQYPGQLNSPEGMKNLEKLADTIVEQQNLGDKSVDELYRQLNRNELDLSGSILQAGQAQKGQKQEVKQEENQLLQPKADGPQQNGPAVEAPQEGEHRKTIVQI